MRSASVQITFCCDVKPLILSAHPFYHVIISRLRGRTSWRLVYESTKSEEKWKKNSFIIERQLACKHSQQRSLLMYEAEGFNIDTTSKGLRNHTFPRLKRDSFPPFRTDKNNSLPAPALTNRRHYCKRAWQSETSPTEPVTHQRVIGYGRGTHLIAPHARAGS